VRGWAQNKKFIELLDNYKSYLTDIKQTMAGLIPGLSIIGLSEKEMEKTQDWYLKMENSLNEVSSISKLQFSMGEEFVTNMSKYFEWGGDWWSQKDYMHFQKK
jgi:hypothetical protein